MRRQEPSLFGTVPRPEQMEMVVVYKGQRYGSQSAPCGELRQLLQGAERQTSNC